MSSSFSIRGALWKYTSVYSSLLLKFLQQTSRSLSRIQARHARPSVRPTFPTGLPVPNCWPFLLLPCHTHMLTHLWHFTHPCPCPLQSFYLECPLPRPPIQTPRGVPSLPGSLPWLSSFASGFGICYSLYTLPAIFHLSSCFSSFHFLEPKSHLTARTPV